MTTKGVPYSWEISQPDGNDEGTDISRYNSLGAPVIVSAKIMHSMSTVLSRASHDTSSYIASHTIFLSIPQSTATHLCWLSGTAENGCLPNASSHICIYLADRN